VRPVASVDVSAPSRPDDNLYHDETGAADHAAAAAALRDAFTRLQPQGSDAWNFLAAFTHLGDRYGPYQPGASDLSKSMDAGGVAGSTRPKKTKRRFRSEEGAGASDGASELEQAMAQVVEAFRFLSARVRTLEERLARQDHPVDGAAWLLAARELGGWVEPVAAHIVAGTPGGEVVHADCGEGGLLARLQELGVATSGVEPRGSVALGALERGHTVVVAEVRDVMAARPAASLGGVVLSGVVDRLPLHSLVVLLAHTHRALAPGAPIVVLATEPQEAAERADVVARDVLEARPLHAETWELLLRRAGFVAVAPLEGDDDARFAVTATTPR
jgi:hypothetical protein